MTKKNGFTLLEMLGVLCLITVITSSLLGILQHSKLMWFDGMNHLTQASELQSNTNAVFLELRYASALYEVSGASTANGYLFFYDKNGNSIELFLNSSYNQSLSTYGYNSFNNDDLVVAYDQAAPEPVAQGVQSFYVKSYIHDYFSSDGFKNNNTYALTSLYNFNDLADISSLKLSINVTKNSHNLSIEKLIDLIYSAN